MLIHPLISTAVVLLRTAVPLGESNDISRLEPPPRAEVPLALGEGTSGFSITTRSTATGSGTFVAYGSSVATQS